MQLNSAGAGKGIALNHCQLQMPCAIAEQEMLTVITMHDSFEQGALAVIERVACADVWFGFYLQRPVDCSEEARRTPSQRRSGSSALPSGKGGNPCRKERNRIHRAGYIAPAVGRPETPGSFAAIVRPNSAGRS